MTVKMTGSDLFVLSNQLELDLKSDLPEIEKIKKQAILDFIKTELLGE